MFRCPYLCQTLRFLKRGLSRLPAALMGIQIHDGISLHEPPSDQRAQWAFKAFLHTVLKPTNRYLSHSLLIHSIGCDGPGVFPAHKIVEAHHRDILRNTQPAQCQRLEDAIGKHVVVAYQSRWHCGRCPESDNPQAAAASHASLPEENRCNGP